MTEEQYQFKKMAIQERLRKEMIDLERRIALTCEQAASQLFDLEQEYRGMKPSCTELVATGVVNDCMKCRSAIPFGYAYCDKCRVEIEEVEKCNLLLAVNLLNTEAARKALG